ncbi:uncharacterized protein [Asterias amurensis]|uniref:uncharacterized protein n=1 Tax=Asterias amurensis TaxID=7602 RepID=UPI003AB134B8
MSTTAALTLYRLRVSFQHSPFMAYLTRYLSIKVGRLEQPTPSMRHVEGFLGHAELSMNVLTLNVGRSCVVATLTAIFQQVKHCALPTLKIRQRRMCTFVESTLRKSAQNIDDYIDEQHDSNNSSSNNNSVNSSRINSNSAETATAIFCCHAAFTGVCGVCRVPSTREDHVNEFQSVAMLLRVVCKNHRPCWGLGSVIIGCVLFLGLIARLGSATKPSQRIPGVCRSIIRKVESFTESKLQSSLVNARGGLCTWLQLNGCQQYKVVFSPIYRKSFRTVYVHGFMCCAGYRRQGNVCVPERPITDSPGPTQGVPEGALPTNTPGSSPGLTGVFLTVGPHHTSPSNVPPRITKDPDSGHTPQPDQNPPHGLVDMKLLIILLVLTLLIVLFAVASYAAHFAIHIQGGGPVCCIGGPRVPKLNNGENIIEEEASQINCVISTISKDCNDDSFRSGPSERTQRSGSDQSGQSGMSDCSGVTFIDDDDSGIVKHVVYEKCWKDTTSLISSTSSSLSSQKYSRESGRRVSTSTQNKCAPLHNLPPTPKTSRPSPPIPCRLDVTHDQTPRSINSTLQPSQPKYSSPARQQRSPSPYSYTSLEKSKHWMKSSPIDIISPHKDTESLIPEEPDNDVTIGDAAVRKHSPTYVNVKLDNKRKNARPVYVTLEPDEVSVALGTECYEDDDDPWMTSHSPASSSIGSSVGYCSLSNQILPHRVSGNGYDKLERHRQNFPVVAENCPPEYAVPSVGTSTSGLTVEDEDNYDRLSRDGSPDQSRSSDTLPDVTFAYLNVATEGVAEIKQAKEVEEVEEERYVWTPRHNQEELVFIEAPMAFKAKKQTSKCISLG